MWTELEQLSRVSTVPVRRMLVRDVPIHRYRHRLISVSFFHIGIGIGLMKIELI